MIIEITDINDARLAPFTSLTEAQLRSRLDPDNAMIIVESPKVIDRALEAGLVPVALLCERRHIEGDAAHIIAAHSDMPVYTADREVLASLTGYTLTRGVLCAMRRPEQPRLEEIASSARRIAVIDGIVDTTNIGAIFRSAAALGIDALAVTRNSCDPLSRRAARVSMGSVFMLPWCWIDNSVTDLKKVGFQTAAMALRKESVDIDDLTLATIPQLAIILGNEGNGLDEQVIDASDHVIKIPMAHGVDSLNVGAAAAVAFFALATRLK